MRKSYKIKNQTNAPTESHHCDQGLTVLDSIYFKYLTFYIEMACRNQATQSLSHSVTQSLSHSVIQSLSHSVTQSLSHSATQPLSHSVCPINPSFIQLYADCFIILAVVHLIIIIVVIFAIWCSVTETATTKYSAWAGLADSKLTMPSFTPPECLLIKSEASSSYTTEQVVLGSWGSANLNHLFTRHPSHNPAVYARDASNALF